MAAVPQPDRSPKQEPCLDFPELRNLAFHDLAQRLRQPVNLGMRVEHVRGGAHRTLEVQALVQDVRAVVTAADENLVAVAQRARHVLLPESRCPAR